MVCLVCFIPVHAILTFDIYFHLIYLSIGYYIGVEKSTSIFLSSGETFALPFFAEVMRPSPTALVGVEVVLVDFAGVGNLPLQVVRLFAVDNFAGVDIVCAVSVFHHFHYLFLLDRIELVSLTVFIIQYRDQKVNSYFQIFCIYFSLTL